MYIYTKSTSKFLSKIWGALQKPLGEHRKKKKPQVEPLGQLLIPGIKKSSSEEELFYYLFPSY